MNEFSGPPRLYDEKEMRRLLKRATELQQEEGATAPHSGGMSLAELEEIAAEAGIDPRHLRRAAGELSSGGGVPSGWEKVTGDQLTLVHETVVPGELSPDGFERVASAIQRAAGEQGQPSLMGRTLTWQAETPGKSRRMLVTVGVRNGETHIRAEERLHQLASGLFAGTTIGGGVGLGVGVGLPVAIEVVGSMLLAFAMPVAAVGLAYMTARQIFGVVVRRRRTALAHLVDAAAREVFDAVADHTLAEQDRPMELPRG